MRAKTALSAKVLILVGLLLPGSFVPAQAKDEPITVVTHVDIIPDAYMAGADGSAARLFRAETAASLKDQGLVSYVVYRAVGAPNHFTVVETWHDAKAYALHVGSPHTVQFRQDIQSFLGSPFDARLDRQFR